MPGTFDDWCDEAAARCAKECGLDPDKVIVGTDYCSVWAIEYNGELTLGQLIRIARFMNVEHEHEKGSPANHLMMSIYDESGRIVSNSVVAALAGRGAYHLKELPPEHMRGRSRYERLIADDD